VGLPASIRWGALSGIDTDARASRKSSILLKAAFFSRVVSPSASPREGPGL
jgi:hypothetical protein